MWLNKNMASSNLPRVALPDPPGARVHRSPLRHARRFSHALLQKSLRTWRLSALCWMKSLSLLMATRTTARTLRHGCGSMTTPPSPTGRWSTRCSSPTSPFADKSTLGASNMVIQQLSLGKLPNSRLAAAHTHAVDQIVKPAAVCEFSKKHIEGF